MKRSIVLGIDIGTGGCKVCAVDDQGQVMGSAGADHPTLTPRPGWVEQRPEDWIRALRRAAHGLFVDSPVRPNEIAAVALSSAAHIGVLLDGRGAPTRNAVLWSDQRSGVEAEELSAEHGNEISNCTYNHVSTTWTLPHLLWIRRHDPEAWQRTKRIVLSKDYVGFRLTGRVATDPATALSSMLFDARAECWSESLCELAGVTSDQLPDVVPVDSVTGTLTPEAADLLTLPPGIPVVCGTLDSAAETLGAGAAAPGQLLLRLASAGGIHLVLNRPHAHPKLITYPHPVAPFWFSQAGTSTCATSVKWAIRTFARDTGMSFDRWDDLAAAVPVGSEGLLFHPYLAGERCPHWDPSLRASFVGVTLRHTLGHFARAVYEGTAFAIRDSLSVLNRPGASPEALTAVGGGTRSALWLRIVCDCLGLPLNVAPHADSSYGAALLGLVALGIFDSPADALAKIDMTTSQIAPDHDNHRLCSRLFDIYCDIHSKLAPLYCGPDEEQLCTGNTGTRNP